jgi:arylsulfatase A-like enzyme
MTTRIWFWQWAWGIACLLLALEGNAAVRPHVILIMADDVGYECFGSYGSRQYLTPNLDKMAAGGMRFTHCYSQPLCTPSRVKLMTGLSNVRNYSAFSILNPDQKTIGHAMQQAGYQTMIAGKWQLLGAENYPEKFRGKGTFASMPDQTDFHSPFSRNLRT